MKIIDLEIKNIRGIKYIHIEPKGKNLVVFGPNGTGKSAIVDAVDFLLSGKIAKLSGKGTKALSIKEHGCHIDYREKLKETVVTAKVEIEGAQFTIQRSIEKPTMLKVAPNKFEKIVNFYLKVAALGQHILSRREILRFITSEEGERAKDIQELLDLSEIEALRSTLVAIETDSKNEAKNSGSNLETIKSDIKTLLSLQNFDKDACVQKINEFRKQLGGSEQKDIDHYKVKDGITPQLLKAQKVFLTKEQIENYIKDTKSLIAKKVELSKEEDDLKKLLEEIKKETKLKQYTLYKKLYEAGITLVDKNNICPLCGRDYNGDLNVYIEARKQETEIAKEKQEEIEKKSTKLKTNIDLLKNNLLNLYNAMEQFGIQKQESQEIRDFRTIIMEWSEAMLAPLERYESERWPSKNISALFDEAFIEKSYFKEITEAITKSGDHLSLQQKAWDILTKFGDKWKTYEQNHKKRIDAELYKKRAEATLQHFERARNDVLEGIYDAVKGKFDTYYKTIHSEDEESFDSELRHEGPSLKFEVDFYKRGKFPPHALHSEGHQDSMGICLFLALNEYLTRNAISVIVLDDVVMSIDQDHRRDICKLLNTFFSQKQLIITTHDNAWAQQLKTEGIVERRNMIRFMHWNIDTGPMVEFDKDIWNKIKEILDKDDVPSAAHKLRRDAECFFENVCDCLYAQIPYKGNRQWDLGEYTASAVSALKSLTEKAKKNYEKAGDITKKDAIEKFYDKAKVIISKSQVEQWAINAEVHFNKWADMKKKDFEPVVNSFKDLFELFVCPKCGGLLAIERAIGKTQSKKISCQCGEINWVIE